MKRNRDGDEEGSELTVRQAEVAGRCHTQTPSDLIDAMVEHHARRTADLVVEYLRAVEFPGYIDQSTSPLGPRKHINAIRSGKLRGVRVRRRYLARREDVDAYIAENPQEERRSVDRDDADALAQELGLLRRSGKP